MLADGKHHALASTFVVGGVTQARRPQGGNLRPHDAAGALQGRRRGDRALSLSDRILVLAEGTVQQVGSPRNVCLRPASELVAGFLGSANFLEGSVRATSAGKALVLAGGDELALAADIPPSTTPVKAVVRPERARVAPFAPDRVGLKGKVLDAIYLGQTVRYHVQTALPQPFVVNSNDKETRFAQGDPVLLAWADTDVWVLPGQGPTPTSVS